MFKNRERIKTRIFMVMLEDSKLQQVSSVYI